MHLPMEDHVFEVLCLHRMKQTQKQNQLRHVIVTGCQLLSKKFRLGASALLDMPTCVQTSAHVKAYQAVSGILLASHPATESNFERVVAFQLLSA